MPFSPPTRDALHAEFLEQQQHAFHAHAETDRRRALAAELGNQAVIAAAATQFRVEIARCTTAFEVAPDQEA